MSASLPPDREPDDLTATLWRDDAALAGMRTLTRSNVLDYFARSPFYDAACNNELLKARGLGLDSLRWEEREEGGGRYGADPGEMERRQQPRPLPPSFLPSLMPAGPEFVLVDAQEPHLFVIRRQLRGAPGAPPTPQALYYVLEGNVYQAPPLGSVLTSRLVREIEGGRKGGEGGHPRRVDRSFF